LYNRVDFDFLNNRDFDFDYSTHLYLHRSNSCTFVCMISVSTDGAYDSGSSMDVDEATTDSGIGLETLTQDGDSGVIGDSVNLSDERPFRSVQTVRTSSV
jgi:hypothetical protein